MELLNNTSPVGPRIKILHRRRNRRNPVAFGDQKLLSRPVAVGRVCEKLGQRRSRFFYPEVCQVCGKARAGAGEGFVGTECWRQVRFIRPPFCDHCDLPFPGDLATPVECANCRDMELSFNSARSAVVARTVLLDAIHQLKCERAMWFEPFLTGLLGREAAPALRAPSWQFIVPVPLPSLKQRQREFNQAEILARHLSAAPNIAMNARLLRRVTPTMTQTRLTQPRRAQNIHGAFAIRQGIKLSGEKIALVDDVFTIGATTSACVRALQAAGAGEVCGWTLARGIE